MNDYSLLRAGVNDVLQDMGMLLGELVDRPAGPGEDSEDTAHALIDAQLNGFFSGFRALKRRHDDQSLSLAVLALTKSGGSRGESAQEEPYILARCAAKEGWIRGSAARALRFKIVMRRSRRSLPESLPTQPPQLSSC